MTRFNIIGKGFLDMEEGSNIAFKQKNPWFDFCEVELGRSVTFNVPLTMHNKTLLGFGDDPAEYGEALRLKYDCQMVYDGGMRYGTITITGFKGDAFECVFFLDDAEWIARLQNMKLSEVPINSYGVTWDTATPVVDADQADPDNVVELIKYDNGLTSPPSWQLLPSVNVKNFIIEICRALGVPAAVGYPAGYWLVTGSMKNGSTESVTLTQTTKDSASVSPASSLIDVVDINIEWAKALAFGAYMGGGTTTAKAFEIKHKLSITFGTVPPDVYLIHWGGSSLKRYKCLGGYPSGTQQQPTFYETVYLGGYGTDLSGQTIDLNEGEIIFFADYFGNVVTQDYLGNSLILTGEDYFGWKDTLHPFSITVDLVSDSELTLGERWELRYNMPDMTVWEFIKSVTLAAGYELSVNHAGLAIVKGSYGVKFKALNKVVSLDSVERTAWGKTRQAVVDFDSEDYVTEKMETVYEVPNIINETTNKHTIKFSEGEVGENGVLIKDASGTPVKFEAKKWTIACVDTAAVDPTYLQRIPTPVAVGYDDIAASSTKVVLKTCAPFADFMGLQEDITLLWRGIPYLWTDADWSDGIMSMTLQKVSQPAYEEPSKPMVRVEYLESTGTQFIDLGIVPDDATGVEVWFEQTGENIGAIFGVIEAPRGLHAGMGQSSTATAYWGTYLGAFAFSLGYGTIALNYLNSRKFAVTQGGTTSEASLNTLPFTPTLTIGLFGANMTGGTHTNWKGRVSRVKVSQGAAVVRDLVAVRVGSVGYMYDQATGTLYANSGTGAFAFGRDLPYDAEVEYLLSSGTQYIDTLIQPNQDLSVEIKWKNETNQTNKYLFGSGTSTSDCIRAFIGTSNYWRFGGGYKSFATNDTTERIAIMDKTKVIMNGEEYNYGGTVGTFSSTKTIKLFAGATATSMISTRIYYFKVSQNGTLILDLIPVRKDGVGYMYDRVSGTLFGNDGTGDFVVGTDV